MTAYWIVTRDNERWLRLPAKTLPPVGGGVRYVLLHKDGREIEDPSPASAAATAVVDTPVFREAQPGDAQADTVPEVVVEPVGSGGQGVVVRARQVVWDLPHKTAGDLPRAIKFVDLARFPLKEFYEEIRASNERPFRNLIPVMDFDVDIQCTAQPSRSFGYLVWQFIEGQTLGEFLFRHVHSRRGEILTRPHLIRRLHDVVLGLVNDCLGALEELHRANLAHIDIKPNNIMVYPQVPANTDARDWLDLDYRAVVIDLGGVRRIGEQARAAGKGKRVPILYTTDFLPGHYVGKVNIRSDAKQHRDYCDADLLAEWGAFMDLGCLGRTLEAAFVDSSRGTVDSNRRRQQFWTTVFGDDFALIEAFVRRATANPPTIGSATEWRERLRTIPLKASRGILDAATLTDQYPGLRIRVGHSLVKVADPLSLIVEHPAFQRLRGLHQLGLVSHVFPDGTHTRFAHSLRTFHLTKRVITALGRRSVFRLVFDRRDVEQLLAASLIHDIGQYPFAHGIEDLRKLGDFVPQDTQNEYDKLMAKALGCIPHDQDRFLDMLKIPDGKGDESRTIGDILRIHELKPDELKYLVQKEERDPNRRPALNISRDLINGVIDVDRIAYLVHDSERTGTRYGLGVDVESLIEGLTIRYHEREGRASSEVGLAIEPGAAAAVEALLAATHWMYRTVYWQHTNRALMAALTFCMMRVLEKDPGVLKSYLQTDSEVSALRLISDAFAPEKDGRNPLAELVAGGRIGYRRIISIGQSDEPDTYTRIMEAITPARHRDLVRRLQEELTGNDGDVLLDIPLKPRFGKPDDKTRRDSRGEHQRRRTKLWVPQRWHLSRELKKDANGEERWLEIAEYSRLVEALGEIEDLTTRKVRVFAHRDLLSKKGSPADWNILEQRVSDAVVRGVADWGQGRALPTKKGPD